VKKAYLLAFILRRGKVHLYHWTIAEVPGSIEGKRSALALAGEMAGMPDRFKDAEAGMVFDPCGFTNCPAFVQGTPEDIVGMLPTVRRMLAVA